MKGEAVKLVNLKMSSSKKDHFRELLLNSLWFFNWEVMRYRDINSPFHREEMAEFDRQRREGVLDFMKLFPRGHLKCVPDDLVLTRHGRKLISELIVGDEIASCDINTLKNIWSRVAATRFQGFQKCVSIKLRSGRIIKVSSNHPVAMLGKWAEASELKSGDRVAVARSYPEPESNSVTIDEARFLGFMVGDGCIASGGHSTSCSFTTADYGEEIVGVAERLGFRSKIYTVDPGCKTYGFSGGARKLIKRFGLTGKNSHTKFIPKEIFGASFEVRIAYLESYWKCDGTVSVKGKTISCTTMSRRLADDTVSLLATVGIVSRICEVPMEYNGKTLIAFFVTVQGKDAIVRFCSLFSFLGSKGENLKKMEAISLNTRPGASNRDTIPPEWRNFLRAKNARKLRLAGIRVDNDYSTTRDKMKMVAGIFEEVKALSESDIYWDEVMAIVPIGQLETWDIEVDNTSCFYYRDLLTHNTCCFTIAGTLQDIARNPNERILIMNATSENAVDILRVISQNIMSNEMFNFYFPGIRPVDMSAVQWKRDKITVNRDRIAKEGTVEAVGIDTNIVGKHFNRIKFDDIVNDENTQSFERMERTHQQFQLATPILEPGGGREVYGTRWAYRDVYGRLIEDGNFQVSLRQLREKDTVTGEDRYIFPQKYNPKEEARIRSTMSDYLFSCQYFNAPVSQKDKLFETRYFKYYETLPPNGVFVTTVDPASTTEKYSNKSAIVTCYWTPSRANGMPGDIYVFRYLNLRLKPEALLEAMITELIEIKPHVFSIEIVQNEGFWDYFMNQCQRRGVDIGNIRKFKPLRMQHKYERIAMLQPDHQAGRLLMKKEHFELQKQMEEYTGWRKNEEDDLVDALAQQKSVGQSPSTTEENDDDAMREAEEDVLIEGTGW